MDVGQPTLTGVLGRTQLAGLPKPVVGARTAALGFGDGTGEGAGTRALVEGPVARATHVGVHAHAAISAHREPPQAVAAEGALGVGTVAVHTDARCLAFVDVCGGPWATATGPSPPPPALAASPHLFLPNPHHSPVVQPPASPTQWRPPGASRKPGLQRHEKLPSSFRHTPLAHMVVVAHSLWSGDTGRGWFPAGSQQSPLFGPALPGRPAPPPRFSRGPSQGSSSLTGQNVTVGDYVGLDIVNCWSVNSPGARLGPLARVCIFHPGTP